MNILLGGIFLALALLSARIVIAGIFGNVEGERPVTPLRACLRAAACSIVLTLFAYFAYETSGAQGNVLPFFFWAYAGVMSVVLGVIGILGAICCAIERLFR